MLALPWFGAFWGLRRLGLVLLGVFVGLLLPLGSLRLVLWRWGLLRLLLRVGAFWGLRRLRLVPLGVLAGQLLRLGRQPGPFAPGPAAPGPVVAPLPGALEARLSPKLALSQNGYG